MREKKGRRGAIGDHQPLWQQRATVMHSLPQIELCVTFLAQESNAMAQVARHTRRSAHVQAALLLAEAAHYAHAAGEALAGGDLW